MNHAMEHPSNDDLSAHLDAELDGPRAQQVASHVVGCQDCRSQLDRLGAVATALSRLPPPVPTDLERRRWRRAVEDVMTLAPVEERRRTAWAPAAAAAAVMLLVVGLLAVLVLRDDSPSPSAVPPTTFNPRDISNSTPTGPASCSPRVDVQTATYTGPEQVRQAIDSAGDVCVGTLRRQDVGRHQKAYSDRISAGLPDAAPCLQSFYENNDAPLLPIYGRAATYGGKEAVVVVFLTSFAGTADQNDPLDGRQAWVFEKGNCTVLTAAG